MTTAGRRAVDPLGGLLEHGPVCDLRRSPGHALRPAEARVTPEPWRRTARVSSGCRSGEGEDELSSFSSVMGALGFVGVVHALAHAAGNALVPLGGFSALSREAPCSLRVGLGQGTDWWGGCHGCD